MRWNLRKCSRLENAKNKSKFKNNTTGHTGVYLEKGTGSWRAMIYVNKENIYLGSFTKKEDAIEARKEAEIKYFGQYRRR